MKKLLLLLSLVSTISVFAGDDVFSFYFKKDGILGLNSVNRVATQLFGKYELSDTEKNEVRRAAGEYLMVDETGIYIEKNRLLSISREEVRENAKYRVSKGWLHGVMEKDSVPCALDGESYYFLIPAKTYLFDVNMASSKLVLISKTAYALFSLADNGNFSAIVANFTNGGVTLNDVSFSSEGANAITKIEKKEELEENGIKTYILTPSKEEWESFVFRQCLEAYDAYVKVAQ